MLEPFTSSCDHNTIELDIDYRLKNTPTKEPKINYYAADYDSINNYLSNIDWESILVPITDIDQMYDNFLQVVHQSINLYAPISNTKQKQFLPKEIRIILKEKRKLYKLSKKDNNFKSAYNKQAKKYKQAVKRYKQQCEQKVVATTRFFTTS